jgi:hypothetical protein
MMRPEPFQPVKADWLQAAMVAAALFALYALTSPRTVAGEDDGVFVLSSYFMGIPHSPGYPLFTLVGKLFTLLPIGSVAYRVHLASALFGALSVGACWLCARALVESRLAAYIAAFGLGLSQVFWSQSIIAEVYTLNTFFFLLLTYLALQARGRFLAGMALIFGLSLSNHWPLMLLAAPAFLILVWPHLRREATRLPLLIALAVLGLAPYAWLVLVSWGGPPISHYGPLQTWGEIWHFVSRSGYAEVDVRPSSGWLDRIRFFGFLGEQLAVQFAFAGTALAAVGFVAQWRALGMRRSAFLVAAFLAPSAGLVLLLGFDYDAFQKHIFHVYPLPAYAVAALWMALGWSWIAERYRLRPAIMQAAAAALFMVFLAAGARTNLLTHYDWSARYAQAVLRSLPQDAVVFVQGEADLGPIAYLHMVENWRPDITLYQASGLVLGNRLFHPLRNDREDRQRAIAGLVDRETRPVVFTLESYLGYARRDRWLFVEVDKSSRDPLQLTVDIPEEAARFFEESIARTSDHNDWAAYFQGELRRRYAILIAQSKPPGAPADARNSLHMKLLANDFYGALGLAEGLMSNGSGYSPGALGRLLERVRETMPSDAPKLHVSRFFHLRGLLRIDLGDRAGGLRDLESSASIWPVRDNPSFRPLEDFYREAGNTSGLQAVRERLGRRKH